MTKRLCYESYAFNNPTSFCSFAYIAEYFTQDRFKVEIISSYLPDILRWVDGNLCNHIYIGLA